MIVADMQLSWRQRWARLLVKGQKIHDVADDLGKYETVAPRHGRHGPGTQPPQLREAALIRQHVDRLNSIPRTERDSLTLRQLVQCGCQNSLIGSSVLASRPLSGRS